MYTRELSTPCISPIENGKPLQGTWVSAFKKVDLTEIAKPFSIFIPKWLVKFRIKEWQNFSVQDDEILLNMLIADMKIFSFIEFFFLNKKTNEKISEFKIFPLSAWNHADNLGDSKIAFKSSGISFAVHNCLDSKSIKLDVEIESSFNKDPFAAQLEFDFAVQNNLPLCVNLLLSENRCAYTYKNITGVCGKISLGSRNIDLNTKTSCGLFCDNKGYYPHTFVISSCSAYGILDKTQSLGFSFADKITREPNKNNENALWVSGELTPLPPVRITQAKDVNEEEWIIQDLEGMVDLSFKPVMPFGNSFKVVLSRFERKAFAGYFHGMLMDKNGKKIRLRNFFGVAEKVNFKI